MIIRHIHRGLWLAAGLVFVLLGLLGLMLPVVPQIPFFLTALLCFMRCSKRFNRWMDGQAWFIRLRERFRNFRHPRH